MPESYTIILYMYIFLNIILTITEKFNLVYIFLHYFVVYTKKSN
jgi:hypothetical protein